MDNDGVFRPTKKENKEFKKAAKEWADGKHEDVTEKYGDISTWDTSKITDMSKLFKEKRNFNGDISNWDVSNVTNMQEMFSNAKAFNQPIGDWNVSNVTSMFNMFHDAKVFNNGDEPGVSNTPLNWNVSKVTIMNSMFWGARAFNQDISAWDVSEVTDMKRMFESAKTFNQDIGKWKVSKVTDMGRMFVRAKHFNQPIVWDVSNVTNMFNMFWSAESFNQSIEEWDVSKISTNYIETMFKYSGYIHPKPDVERSKARYRDKQNLSGVQIAARNSLPDHRVMEELGLRKSVPSALSKRGETEMHPRVRQVLSWEEGRGPQISEWLGGKRKTKKRKTKKRKTKKSNRK
jgi:surface protein